MRTATLAAIGLLAAALVTGCQRPGWEVRTFRGGTGVTTDPTFQQNMSKIRGRYVCPYCGYSTNVVLAPGSPGTCPNPWGVSGHPANTTLEYKPVEDSFLTMSSAGYLVGLPFHPKTGSNVDGSTVHAAVAGLLDNPNVQDGDYVRFLFLMPGAKYPAARAESVNTAGGLSLTPDNVHLNPYRVTDGEQIRVQRSVANVGGVYNVQVVVWSNLDGLEFFVEFTGVGVVPASRTIVTATGSALIELPAFPTPNDGEVDTDYCVITVKSNCTVVPHEPVSDPGGWGSWFSTIPEPFDNCFEVPAAGSPGGDRVADWLNNVVGTGSPITAATGFYQIPEGAVGKGWVFVLWRKRDYSLAIEDGALAPGCSYGDAVWYDGPDAGQAPTEWNYDWLVEDGGTAAVGHLWGNCPAVANPANSLEDYHTPVDAAGHFRPTDPPWYMACAFISSRLQVPLTGDVRVATGTPIEPDSDPNTGVARIFIGTKAGASVGGSYVPGSTTPVRTAAVNNRMTPVLKCPECGSVTTDLNATECPYCGATLTAADNKVDGEAAVAVTVDQPLSLSTTAANPNPRNTLANCVSIPFDAVKYAPTRGYIPPGSVGPGAFPLSLLVDLPKSTVPSVPPIGPDPVRPNMATDDGYVGRLVIYNRDEPLAGPETFVPGLDGTEYRPGAPYGVDFTQPEQPKWTMGYRCPTCGKWYEESQVPGPCVSVPPNPSEGYRVCPVCAVASLLPDPPSATSECPFCGRQLDASDNFGPADTFCGAPRITEEDLDAQEYAAFEVQVSVQREFTIAGGAGGVGLGRVAPGVPPGNPDTTVGTSGVAPADPGDVTLPPRPFSIVNSGNVRAPITLEGTDLSRADADLFRLSVAGLAGRVPFLISDLFAWRWDGTAFAGIPAVPAEEGTAGGGPSAGGLQAGNRAVAAPVPLGQPAGTHAGRLVVFSDLDGDGNLDFYQRSTGTVTDTSASVFDADGDLPLEPVADLDVSLRVGEGRIPHNDYFSADVAPVVGFDLDSNGEPVGLHVVWMTNRAPAGGVDSDAPAGSGPGDTRPTDAPFNLVYANASLVAPGGLYRHYEWQATGPATLAEAKALTVDAAPGTVNESPFVLTFPAGAPYERMVFWHRLLPTAAGWESTLRFAAGPTSGYGPPSGTAGFVYSASDMQSLRALASTPFGAGRPWLFWHAGARGHEMIYHLPNFDPAAPAPGQPLPVSLSFASRPHDEREDVAIPGLAGLASVHRFAASPFTYARDPYAWLMIDPGGGSATPLLNVAFTGHVREDGNTDICWVRFAWDANGVLNKVAFPRLTGRVAIAGSGLMAGERLQADAKRQVFSSRHLEWAVHDVAGDDYGMAPSAAYDPDLFLAVTTTGGTFVYEITWAPGDPPQRRWVRTRNAYVVQPRFTKVWPAGGADPLFAARAYPGDPAGGYRVVDPPTAQMPTPQPLMAEINPATGVVTFSSPLFNSEAPDDASAVVNLSNVAGASDAHLYANYTPLVWRVCRDPAADDSPWVFWRPEDTGGLTIFWRRTYSSADPPHEGRSVFLYKQFAPAVQLQYPPVSGTVQYWDGSSWQNLPTPRYVTYPDTGYIADTNMTLTTLPTVMLLQYTGAGAVRQERRTFVGWTEERRVPVETEMVVGPFSVAQETYSAAPGAAQTITRFWLAWSSPRAIYDLRPAAANGADWRQSADVYLATVVPNLHTAVAEPVQ